MILVRRTLVCDLVQNVEGKYNLFGLFDAINVQPPFPAQLPPFYMFASLYSTEPNELKFGETRLTIEMSDAKGIAIIGPFGGALPGEKGQGVPPGSSLDCVIQVQGAKVPEAGDYRVVVKVDGNEMSDFRVRVRQM